MFYDMDEELVDIVNELVDDGCVLLHYSNNVAYMADYKAGNIGLVQSSVDYEEGEEKTVCSCWADAGKLKAVLKLYDIEAKRMGI